MAAENAHEVTASLPKRSDLSARRLRAGAIPDDVMEDDFNRTQATEISDTMRKEPRECLDAAGAERLVAKIIAFWRKQGIEANAVAVPFVMSNRKNAPPLFSV
jgi:hypothetical protein